MYFWNWNETQTWKYRISEKIIELNFKYKISSLKNLNIYVRGEEPKNQISGNWKKYHLDNRRT